MKLPKLLLIFLAITLLLPASAGALTVDLYNDFPDTQGINGIYAYYYDASLSTPYVELEDGGDRIFLWTKNAFIIDNTPYIKHISDPSSVILLHPYKWGDVNQDAVLAWVVPETNTYIISGTFQDGDTDPENDGVNVYIRINNDEPI